jgi:ATP-dependent 26S proteasome regulatory subunit
LHAAFRTLHELPSDEVKCLLIDEVDAVCVNRGTSAGTVGRHQEDMAATAEICRELDCLSGVPRAMVIMTTNIDIDPAVQRRCFTLEFGRPGGAARLQLLTRWLPGASEHDLTRATKISAGMSPVDIDAAMERAYLSAIADDRPLLVADALMALRTGTRTKGV